MSEQQRIEYNRLIAWVDNEASAEVKDNVKTFIDFLYYRRDLPRIKKALATINHLVK